VTQSRLRVETRLGDTLLDVAYLPTRGRYVLGETPLVSRGLILGHPNGTIGLVRYSITRAELPARSVRYTRSDHGRVLRYLGAALALHLVLWGVAVETHPFPRDTGTGDPREPIDADHLRRRARIVCAPAPPDPPPSDVVVPASVPGMTLGNPNPGRPERLPGPHFPRRQARSNAERAGRPELEGQHHMQKADLDSNLYGGLLGNEAGEMNGGFGFGRSGFGPGGGGTGWGTIGTGRYGTIGHGSGTGYLNNCNCGGMRGRAVSVPTPRFCDPKLKTKCAVAGGLDQNRVRRHVKRQFAKLEYCFDKQVVAANVQSASVVVVMRIDASGIPQMIAPSGTDAKVTDCVRGVLDDTTFPKSDEATSVQFTLAFGDPPSR
jgi:hypothetical protein